MTTEAPKTASPVTKAYQEAMAKLSAGELSPAVKTLLRIHEEHPDSEEAYFVEEQLARVRRLWPVEAEKAGLGADVWQAVQERAAKRRAAAKAPAGATGVAVLMFVITAWALLVAVAPRVAFLGRIEVPLIFRLIGGVVGVTSGVTALGLMNLKWEAVNAFIVLVPIFMIATFIGFTETAFLPGKVIFAMAFIAEGAAAYYMSKQSHRFIY